MEKLIKLFPVALLLVLTTACGNAKGVSPERQEFEEGVENQITEFINQQIEDAKERSQELSGDAKREMDEAIRELEVQRDNLVAELEEMGTAGDEGWDALPVKT